MDWKPEDTDRLVWGKSAPRVPLAQHMIAAGACMRAYLEAPSSGALRGFLAEALGMDEAAAVRTVAYVAALHDIGKAHPAFLFIPGEVELWEQIGYDMVRYTPNLGFRHEVFSEKVVNGCWGDGALFPRKVAHLFAAVIRLHHQGKQKGDVTGGKGEPWPTIHNELEARMRALFQPARIGRDEDVRNRDALGILLTGLLVLSDWVASSERFGACGAGAGDAACLEWALDRAARTLLAYGLISDREDGFPSRGEFDAFWPNIPREGMRPLQRACEALGGVRAGLTIIEAPPGEGKTEAALYLAGRLCALTHKRGVYMALPTTATSNQMVERVRALMRAHGLGEARLLHGSAWMLDAASPGAEAFSVEDDAGDAANWLRPLRRALLSENAVGTVDQAMAAVLKIKYGMLRLAGLANKVLIVDEIHAYDAYMSRILLCLMQWCRALEIPVILLSATLHRRQKRDYLGCFADVQVLESTELSQAYPLITQVDAAGRILQHPVEGAFMRTRCRYRALPLLGDVAGLVRWIQERTRAGGCYCVMLNTVGRAQEVYRALVDAGETQARLFHARFRMRRRAEIEEECLRLFGRGGARPERMILVCTQVVEQSLDLDFDGMISELAPVDLLIQRAGRVHRHGENPRPEGMRAPLMEVIVPGEGAPEDPEERYGVLSAIYAQAELKNTEEWLGEGRDLRVPEDVRPAIDAVYESFNPDNLEIYALEQARDSMRRVSAEGSIYREPREDSFFGCMESISQQFGMEDVDDLNLVSGAKTREGESSVRVAFLPQDFECDGSELERARKILLESASIRLTGEGFDDRIREKEIDKECKVLRFLRGCAIARPEEDGSYLVFGRQFLADDELGIREVKRER